MIPPTKEVDVITAPVWLLHRRTLDSPVFCCLLQVSVNIQKIAELFKEHKFEPLEMQQKETHERKTEVSLLLL